MGAFRMRISSPLSPMWQRNWRHSRPFERSGTSGESRDVSARLGHIKGQLNAAWEQTMWQTFREEATLLNIPAGDSH